MEGLPLDVIVTSDPQKIPPEILALQDQAQPLPQDAQFFEQRFTFWGMMQTATIGLVPILIGLVAFAFFISMLIASFGSTSVAYSQFTNKIEFGALAVSAVFWFGSYLMLSSLVPAARFAWSREHTRYGITLLGDRLVSYSLFDTTVIPRDKFTSIAGNKIGYLLGDSEKSFTLPDIVEDRRPQLEAAIQGWKAESN
jgi:hypothetical protein